MTAVHVGYRVWHSFAMGEEVPRPGSATRTAPPSAGLQRYSSKKAEAAAGATPHPVRKRRSTVLVFLSRVQGGRLGAKRSTAHARSLCKQIANA